MMAPPAHKASATGVRATLHQRPRMNTSGSAGLPADLREFGCYLKRQERAEEGRRKQQAEGWEVDSREGVLVIEPSRRSRL